MDHKEAKLKMRELKTVVIMQLKYGEQKSSEDGKDYFEERRVNRIY